MLVQRLDRLRIDNPIGLLFGLHLLQVCRRASWRQAMRVSSLRNAYTRWSRESPAIFGRSLGVLPSLPGCSFEPAIW